MIQGDLDCSHSNMKFRFQNRAEAEETLENMRKGCTASRAILREVRCYILNPARYPFKEVQA